ncbi:MAG: hypothetical protein N4A57_07520 [Anaeromicrobium sp.]|jgi:hypothetical protein|uniref:hypothetical protein n=1 Tax=Anaeromicrobium sp. TaxID=1929132 RepID=UPI0025E3CA93|nr:hypothetical protein [Anaeromicrobium sp.]MCT4594099.1 hypothetical protein [Anaeromicrobium sp.]
MEIGIKAGIFIICYFTLSIFFNNMANKRKRSKISEILRNTIISTIVYVLAIIIFNKLKGV